MKVIAGVLHAAAVRLAVMARHAVAARQAVVARHAAAARQAAAVHHVVVTRQANAPETVVLQAWTEMRCAVSPAKVEGRRIVAVVVLKTWTGTKYVALLPRVAGHPMGVVVVAYQAAAALRKEVVHLAKAVEAPLVAMVTHPAAVVAGVSLP